MDQATTNNAAPAETPAPPALELAPLPADAPWWARWLVDDWKRVWRYASFWFPVVVGAIASLWPMYGPEILAHISARYVPFIVAAVFWISSGLRVIKFIRKVKQ